MHFDSLGLLPALLEVIAEKGYKTPSPIQLKAIPPVLEGRDVMAAAQTGTGKTAGFTLPVLQRLSNGPKVKPNQVRALILTPTRELAAQVAESVTNYGCKLPLRAEVVYGGVKINPQMMRLRKGADVLVATPGRLIDLFNQNAIKFDQLEIFVLDEADRMLDMGFIHDIKKIMRALPKRRQNLLFSATFSPDIRSLAKSLVNNPVEVSVSPPNATVDLVEQIIYPVDKSKKPAILSSLIVENQWTQVLVFSRTKHGANRLSKLLTSKGVQAAAIHGNKSQGARTRALKDFKQGDIQVLVATDIAARGLDIDQLPYVVNFDLPSVPEDYVHRIGRTGRAGSRGKAISLVSADDFKLLSDIERLIQQLIPRVIVEGFEPQNTLPESQLDKRPFRKKKPKKPKKPKKQKTEHQDGQRSADNARGHKPAGKNKKHRAGQKAASTKAESLDTPSSKKRKKPKRPSSNSSVDRTQKQAQNFWAGRSK